MILLDEPSLGLAPLFIKTVYEIIKDIHTQGTLSSWSSKKCIEGTGDMFCAYVMDAGRIVVSGPSQEIAASDEIRKTYLGE